jgi:hypothetical protein
MGFVFFFFFSGGIWRPVDISRYKTRIETVSSLHFLQPCMSMRQKALGDSHPAGSSRPTHTWSKILASGTFDLLKPTQSKKRHIPRFEHGARKRFAFHPARWRFAAFLFLLEDQGLHRHRVIRAGCRPATPLPQPTIARPQSMWHWCVWPRRARVLLQGHWQ